MIALQESNNNVDPKLVDLCMRARGGDNDACDALELRALDGDSDALSLLKIANAPSKDSGIYEDFCRRNREMMEDLLDRIE